LSDPMTGYDPREIVAGFEKRPLSNVPRNF
jgi:hypothetical protein